MGWIAALTAVVTVVGQGVTIGGNWVQSAITARAQTVTEQQNQAQMIATAMRFDDPNDRAKYLKLLSNAGILPGLKSVSAADMPAGKLPTPPPTPGPPAPGGALPPVLPPKP